MTIEHRDQLEQVRKESPLLSTYPLMVIDLLWRAWSEQKYMAGFMRVEPDYIVEFRRWFLEQLQAEQA